MVELLLLSWNILAPCLVRKEWYPTLYDLAADHRTRVALITLSIASLRPDICMLQEAQEDMIPVLVQNLGDDYLYQFAPNNPSECMIGTGLLVLIRKDWKFASEAKVANGILDPERGAAIQIITLPSQNIHLVNMHLDYEHHTPQAKLVQKRCTDLLNSSHPVAVMAGDMNAERTDYDNFGWIGYEDVFGSSSPLEKVPTYYPDPASGYPCGAVDHIFYDRKQVELIESSKAWNSTDRTLNDALQQLGSDHIYVSAHFKFSPTESEIMCE